MRLSLTNNREINRLHERYLRFISGEKGSLFSELLVVTSSPSIHMMNIQSAAIDMFSLRRNISRFILNDFVTQKGNSWYNLKQISEFSRQLVKLVYHGRRSTSFLGPQILYIPPDDFKDENVIIFV